TMENGFRESGRRYFLVLLRVKINPVLLIQLLLWSDFHIKLQKYSAAGIDNKPFLIQIHS
ncbi:hypothetical protein L9F63_028096, partial [Diploptera punctata]